MFSIVVLVCLGFAVFLFAKSFVIIPIRRVAVEERLGKFVRILYPGWYFIMWPFSYLRMVRWKYIGQNGQPIIRQTDLISYEKTQMDIPPIKSISKDKIRVRIDGTIMYTIVNPQKAVYDTDDIINLFYQRVVQAVNQTCSKFSAEELSAMHDDVAESVRDRVNTDEEFPVFMNEFLVQEVLIDEKILMANQSIHASARMQEMKLKEVETRLALQEAEQKSKEALRQIARDQEMAELEHERRKQTERIKMQLEFAQAEADKRKMQWDGFTVEQRIEMERVRGMQAMMAAGKTKVFAPLEYWTAGKFVVEK